MRRGSRRFALVAATVVATGTLFPASVGRAQPPAPTVYEVKVAAFLGEGTPLPAESMRFFPSSIKVHKGDVLHFTSQSFHTATLLPVGQIPEAWIGPNAGSLTAPWSLYSKDPDEGANGAKLNNRALFGPRDCGAPTAPCSFDGKGDPINGVLNSGVPLDNPLDFSVTIDANPGETVWALCLVHTHMRMKISVVADDAAADVQATIDQDAATKQAFDQDWAQSTHNKLVNKRSSHTAGNDVVWDVNVGYDNHWTSLFAMYPAKLKIRKGDTVRFHFDGLIYEEHTATLPGSAVRQFPFIAPACDPDGDSGTAPDNPPDTEGPPFCNDPGQLELDGSPELWVKQGDGAYRGGTDLEGSGFRGPEGRIAAAPFNGNASFDVRFTKLSGDKGFKYKCAIHPFMRGKIFVV